jgi:hypothetical protein
MARGFLVVDGGAKERKKVAERAFKKVLDVLLWLLTEQDLTLDNKVTRLAPTEEQLL